MADQETAIAALSVAAISIGFLHTLFGPDHYLPFIVMSRAREWSRTRTVWITFLCGLGHVGSSVVLGMVGVALGIALNRLTPIEESRGSIAAWLLVAFGLAYAVWGLHRALKNRPHTHAHIRLDPDSIEEHTHNHCHDDESASGGKLERYARALAGVTIALCGVAIVFGL